MDSARRDGTQIIAAGRGDRVNYDRPVAALDTQLALLDWTRTADWQEMLAAFTKAYNPAFENDVVSKEPNQFRDWFVVPGVSASLNGMAQYISAEICDLVTAIAEEMPPEILFPTDLQFFDGLLVLGKKLHLPQFSLDDEHRLVTEDIVDIKIRAIGYSRIPEDTAIKTTDGLNNTDGLQFFLYTTTGDAIEYTGYRGRTPLALNPNSALARAPLVLSDHTVWGFGSPWSEAKCGEVVTSFNAVPKISYLRRWLLALWRLMWQEILHPDPFRVDRPAYKRAVRLMPQRHDGDVLRIIRLRKIDETVDDWMPDGGNAMRELRHGYVRRGHWRTLHRDEDTERKVWVRAHYVRPDLPQADSYKVVSVER